MDKKEFQMIYNRLKRKPTTLQRLNNNKPLEKVIKSIDEYFELEEFNANHLKLLIVRQQDKGKMTPDYHYMNLFLRDFQKAIQGRESELRNDHSKRVLSLVKKHQDSYNN